MSSNCLNCMKPLAAAVHYCPECGFDNQAYRSLPHQLRAGTMLNGRYLIGRVLGEGGFGITYVGLDTLLELKVAVKEFYMTGINSRNHTASDAVQITNSNYGEDFIHNRRRFLEEAQVLAKLSGEPGIVMVRDFFEANNTAYIVMEFLNGQTLQSYLEKNGKLRWSTTWKLMKPVLESLKRVHAHGIIHRDISPDNIMMTGQGQIKLLDFGAARRFAGSGQHSLSVIMKLGYAPAEQYSKKGVQGPWTDVYAICATMYRCLTGKVPEEPAERMNGAEITAPAAMGCCTQRVSDVIMKGLAFGRLERWQSVDELLEALEQANKQPAPAPPRNPVREEDPDATVYAGSTPRKREKPPVDPDETVFAGNSAQKPQQQAKVTPPQKKPETTPRAQEKQPYVAKEQSKTPPKVQPKPPTPGKHGQAEQSADAVVQAAGSSSAKKSGDAAFASASGTVPKSTFPSAAKSTSPKPAVSTTPKGTGWRILGYISLTILLAAFVIYWFDLNATSECFLLLKGLFRYGRAEAELFLLAAALVLSAIVLAAGMVALFAYAGKVRTERTARKNWVVKDTLWRLSYLTALIVLVTAVVMERKYSYAAYSVWVLFPINCMVAVLVQAGVGPKVLRKKRVATQLIALFLSAGVLAYVSDTAPSSGYAEMLSVPLSVLLVMPFGELIGSIAARKKPKQSAAQNTAQNAAGYCYFDCPGCKQKFRVPAGKGKVKVTCPHCKRKYETTT